ncbi:putative signal transducing protein [Verrucomicrobiota bacterium]
MITIATYRKLMSAELAKTRLEFYGINAMIADAFFYTLGYGSTLQGVRLQVSDEDAERAQEILASKEIIDLPDDSVMITESPEADQESAAKSPSSRPLGWPAFLVFLFGIVCLILGRPAGDLRIAHPFSGQLILLGVISIVAALWIFYGRLNTADEHEIPPEE